MATNLQFITETEITSAVTSFDVDNTFSDEYDMYKIIFRNFKYGNNATWISLRFLDSSGNAITTQSYNYATINAKAQASFTELRGSATSLPYTVYTNNGEGYGSVLNVYTPFDSDKNTFTTQQDTQFVTGLNLYTHKNIGVIKNAATHRGIHLNTRNTNTFEAGQIKVFGVK